MKSVTLFAAISLSNAIGQAQPASAPPSQPPSASPSGAFQRTEQKLDELCCKIDSLEGLLKAFKQIQHEQKKP